MFISLLSHQEVEELLVELLRGETSQHAAFFRPNCLCWCDESQWFTCSTNQTVSTHTELHINVMKAAPLEHLLARWHLLAAERKETGTIQHESRKNRRLRASDLHPTLVKVFNLHGSGLIKVTASCRRWKRNCSSWSFSSNLCSWPGKKKNLTQRWQQHISSPSDLLTKLFA